MQKNCHLELFRQVTERLGTEEKMFFVELHIKDI